MIQDNIKIKIGKLKTENSSDNKYCCINFESKQNTQDHTKLCIGFTHDFLNSSTKAKSINFNDVIEKEIKLLLKDIGDNLFENERYFVLYSLQGRNTNVKFHPFID